jgi:hypothetical protein
MKRSGLVKGVAGGTSGSLNGARTYRLGLCATPSVRAWLTMLMAASRTAAIIDPMLPVVSMTKVSEGPTPYSAFSRTQSLAGVSAHTVCLQVVEVLPSSLVRKGCGLGVQVVAGAEEIRCGVFGDTLDAPCIAVKWSAMAAFSCRCVLAVGRDINTEVPRGKDWLAGSVN